MKLNSIKRIATEDFENKDRALVQKLAFALNPFLEQITAIFNKNIDFDNLNQEVINFTGIVDASGVPTTQTQIKTSLKTRIQGMICIRVQTLERDNALITTAPFVNFSTEGNLITIESITGIPANKRHSITVILIG